MSEKDLHPKPEIKSGRGGKRVRNTKWSKKQGQNLCLTCDQIFTYKIDPLDDPKVQRRCYPCKVALRNSDSI